MGFRFDSRGGEAGGGASPIHADDIEFHGRLDIGSNDVNSIAVYGDAAYLLDNQDGLHVIDISNPPNPSLVESITLSLSVDSHLSLNDDEEALYASYNGRIEAFDISTPTAISSEYNGDTLPGYSYPTYLTVDGEAYLFNPGDPHLVHIGDSPFDPSVWTVYMGNYNGASRAYYWDNSVVYGDSIIAVWGDGWDTGWSGYAQSSKVVSQSETGGDPEIISLGTPPLPIETRLGGSRFADYRDRDGLLTYVPDWNNHGIALATVEL